MKSLPASPQEPAGTGLWSNPECLRSRAGTGLPAPDRNGAGEASGLHNSRLWRFYCRHCIAGIHHKLRVFAHLVIRHRTMVCDDQNRIRLLENFRREVNRMNAQCAFAPFRVIRNLRIMVGHIRSQPEQTVGDLQGRGFTHIIHIPFVGHPEDQDPRS